MDMVKVRLHREAEYAHQMHNVIDSGPYRYVSAFMNAKPYVKYISLSGMSMLQALKLTKNKYDIEGPELFSMMRRMNTEPVLRPLKGVYEADSPMPIPPGMNVCPYPKRFNCDPHYPFRSYDGSCNNLEVPIWGRSLIPFRRMLPANYADGIETMRRSVLGGPLPGARVASFHLFPDIDRPDPRFTLVMMTFGQFTDHDLTRTAITKTSRDELFFDTSNLEDVKCGFDGCEATGPGKEACWPIPVPDEDPDFPYNRCLKFVRSAEVPPLSCEYSSRESLNQLTSWLDTSQIYGSTLEELKKLRDFSDSRRGRMLMSRHPAGSIYKPLLVQDDLELCRDVNATVRCFAAGDERVNENVPLTTMHTVWAREHNRIEEQLHIINPHWSGERLFQETRKIIGAMFQHIVMHEYLPTILGPDIMRRFDLEVVNKGFARGVYDPKLNPQPAVAFSTAAFRFGHTLIHERIRRTDHHQNIDESLMLSQAFRRPAPLYDTGRGGVDSLIRGIVEQPCQRFDQFFTKQITKSLFSEKPPFGPGVDLLSLNIQRARDHGLPGYNAYREQCGLKRAYTFEDLAGEVTDVRARRMLQKIYKHPDDIDLFAGGVSEASMKDGVVGPTFGCIIGETFHNVKHGDRFWYERDHDAGFTLSQLNEIRKVRMPRIMCENSDDVTRIQPNIFFQSANDYVPKLDTLRSDGSNEYWFDLEDYTHDYDYTLAHDRSNKLQGYRALANEHPVLDTLPPGVAFNVRVPCESFPSIDLRKWREGPYTGDY